MQQLLKIIELVLKTKVTNLEDRIAIWGGKFPLHAGGLSSKLANPCEPRSSSRIEPSKQEVENGGSLKENRFIIYAVISKVSPIAGKVQKLPTVVGATEALRDPTPAS